MPFKSRQQIKWMYANKPKLAAKWEDKYGIPKKLPDELKQKRGRKKSFNVKKTIAYIKKNK